MEWFDGVSFGSCAGFKLCWVCCYFLVLWSYSYLRKPFLRNMCKNEPWHLRTSSRNIFLKNRMKTRVMEIPVLFVCRAVLREGVLEWKGWFGEVVHLRKDGLHRPHCHSFHCILYPDTPTIPQIPLACSSMPRLLHSNQARTPQTPAAPSFVRTYPTPAIIFSKHGLISFPPLSRRFNSIQRLVHFHYASTRKDMQLLLPSPFLTRGLAAFRNSLFFFHACCVFHNNIQKTEARWTINSFDK
jgi:hypothetical protein